MREEDGGLRVHASVPCSLPNLPHSTLCYLTDAAKFLASLEVLGHKFLRTVKALVEWVGLGEGVCDPLKCPKTQKPNIPGLI